MSADDHPMTATAVTWGGPGVGFRAEQLPLPDLAAGEALVEIELATICGSDLHTTAGDRPTPVPTVLGHEAVGRVIGTADDVTTVDGRPLAVGERVSWTIGTSCGRCRPCRRGLPEKCTTLRKYGHEQISPSWALNGDFATHCHLLPGTGIVTVPDSVPAALAAPANCATATVVAALRRAGLQPEDDITVLGCGMLGLTAIALARHHRARRVIACDVDPERRALAARFGADAVVEPDGLEAAVGERGTDVVLEVSGHHASVAAALETAAVGGTVALVGSVSPGPDVPLRPDRVVRRILTIVGSHNYAAADLAAAIDFLADSAAAAPLEELVSAPLPLSDLEAAFTDARRGRTPRVAVDPTR